VSVINAENALERAEDDWLDTLTAGTRVRRLEERLDWYLENEPGDTEKINDIKDDLDKAWNDFSRTASDSVDAREVTVKEMGVELAQAQLEDAQIAIEDAQKDLEKAQEELDEAKSKSPVITALFDGFITRVNVEGGDEVLTGTVAVQLADPNKFEADILVSEMDILQVKLGGEAWVQVDAMQGLSLPAEVTHISPTATIQSGVVNYEVKVEVQPIEEVMQEQQGQIPAAIPENFQLREGLTVTVSIIVDQRNDILLVPNAAITTQGKQTYVQVVLPDGTIEERAIQTGISDWQYTEVTSGLSEGEQVAVPQGTATIPTTQQNSPRGMMIPGMGRPHE
ncbi:MAG TPA: HlyD family efflux transporter periplasmic adaptor subunit, partial [Dehalococcoidales bacterium]|nr:HlyD family efflux transporter periplasmic adaptor subunit [Dehalococcoidales bacterium]